MNNILDSLNIYYVISFNNLNIITNLFINKIETKLYILLSSNKTMNKMDFDKILMHSNSRDYAKSLGSYQGDFLSTLNPEKSAKSYWNDLYFYLIADPMKQKT
jgi:hypothetical protein